MATDGTIHTVAGNGEKIAEAGTVLAGTKGTDVALGAPNAVAVSPDGTVFIADSLASRVYALSADGTIEVRVTAELLGGPIATINALAVSPSGSLFLADRENSRIVEIPAEAGARPVSTSVPLPTGLAADAVGGVWISSATSQLSRLQAGGVATIVGSSDGGWTADDRRPTASPFNATAVSAGGNGVYIVDNLHRRVLQLVPDGRVSTAADLPVDPFGTHDPVGLATSVTAGGPLYLVDTVGSRIFSIPAAAAGDIDPAEPVWPWIAGGAVAVPLVVLFLVIHRRQRTGGRGQVDAGSA
ncbi:hypothetical protein ACFQ5G_02885 [Actinoplanes sichuanensis]|uniref:NHL repeat-containing protein n=1 Tax=Actinoplanes sichuanensis TaxID=512349 RepID=A0ABW4A0Q8_9ACTN|nr:hypothetical protein [Actinoplanes sichuanensis]